MVLRMALLSALLIPTFFLPIAVAAQEVSIPAGFAPSSVWLSRTNLVAESSVRIYTVVYNSSESSLEGSVSFLIDTKELSTSPFVLVPGDSKIVSTTWTPSEGTHTVSAKIISSLDQKTKESRTLASTVSSSLSVTVAPLPPKPVALQTLDTASDIVASSTPLIASAVANVASATETLRKAGESYLTELSASGTSDANSASAESSRKGSVLGAETLSPEGNAPTKKTVVQKIAGFLLPVFATPALFYLAFIGLLLLLFFLLIRKLRNPRRR